MQRQLSRNVFSQSAKRNQQLVGPRSGTRHAAIRGRLGAHRKEGGVPGRTGWCTRCDCAGSRFATCLGLNVRDSGKEIEVLNRMTLSLESEQNVGSRSEWQSQAGVVAGRSVGGQWEHGQASIYHLRYGERLGGLSSGRTACDYLTRLARRPRRGSNQRPGWCGQVPSRYRCPPIRQGRHKRHNQRVAFVAPRRHANARLCVLTL